jgi:phenylalanyl-tRNA synthetase beta subunit
LQDTQNTLQDDQVDGVMGAMVDAAKAKLDAKARS